MTIQEGKPAPAFSLVDSQGKTHRLADYRGQQVILYFYPRDNTPGCTKEACGFRDLQTGLAALNAVVLGVSPDGAAAHEKFVADFGLPFTLLSDPEHKVMQSYGAWGEKTLYGKKTTGVIRSTVWIGADGRVKRHWKKVAKAEAHPQQVLEALQAD
ncbi:MAG: thioredoxin-dependent thiol peroxidase [Pseudomonadota bacterium]